MSRERLTAHTITPNKTIVFGETILTIEDDDTWSLPNPKINTEIHPHLKGATIRPILAWWVDLKLDMFPYIPRFKYPPLDSVFEPK